MKISFRYVRMYGDISRETGTLCGFPVAPDVDFVAHREGKAWRVSEYSTGLHVGAGKTKTEALESTGRRLVSVGLPHIKKAIAGQPAINSKPFAPAVKAA